MQTLIPAWLLIPFAVMLLSIAVLPLLPKVGEWWEENRNKLLVSLLLGIPVAIWLCVNGLSEHLIHQMVYDYVPFILLLMALFVTTGGNVLTVCSMENFDPVGVHTGDSIVIAPTVTLADKEYQMLRSAALNIISALEIEGGCNCQFALNPETFEYAVIEVNPRDRDFLFGVILFFYVERYSVLNRFCVVLFVEGFDLDAVEAVVAVHLCSCLYKRNTL